MIKDSQVFVPESDDSWEKDDKLTVVGWLRKLYLFVEDGEYLDIPEKSRTKYDKCVDLLTKYAKTKAVDIYTWEEKTKLKIQVRILNKIIAEIEKGT